jgi:hypothetical protein
MKNVKNFVIGSISKLDYLKRIPKTIMVRVIIHI